MGAATYIDLECMLEERDDLVRYLIGRLNAAGDDFGVLGHLNAYLDGGVTLPELLARLGVAGDG